MKDELAKMYAAPTYNGELVAINTLSTLGNNELGNILLPSFIFIIPHPPPFAPDAACREGFGAH